MAAKKSLMDTMQAFEKATPAATLEATREAEITKPAELWVLGGDSLTLRVVQY
jgi:hypothetical protein